MKIVTADQMRRIDGECARSGTPVSILMENAGKAVAEEARRALGNLKAQNILCLAGAGNNGGDGLVAARYLHDWGAKVSIYLCSGRPADDPNLKLAVERGITFFEAHADGQLETFDGLLAAATCVIDALLGTGRVRPLEGPYQQVLGKVSDAKKAGNLYVVAVDLPSGLDADTGAIDPATPSADLTVTLAFPKPGLFLFPGAEKVGKLVISDIGIPATLADDVKTELLTEAWAAGALPPRPLNANKGTFGRTLVVAGSINYTGAAYLACMGAYRVGAGLVTLAVPQSLHAVFAAKMTETTFLPLTETAPGEIDTGAVEAIRDCLKDYNVMLLGCGLGQSAATKDFILTLLQTKDLPPLVLDADALNIMSQVPGWWKLVPKAIVTPHPGEMARLLGSSIKSVQSDRFGVAKRAAADWNTVVVLKGAHSIIASPDGFLYVSPFANPGLASAGTGDVLSGVIAGLLAQGLPAFEAASLGVYLHGAAGETIKNIMGHTGMLASDLLIALPVTIKEIREKGNRGKKSAIAG